MHDILQVLDVITTVEQINLPGLNLHKLQGNLKEFHSVKINGNWRLIFMFKERDAYLIDYIDYH